MKKTLREQKAITLVALIITIIVLLVLAIVSINLVINSGIISKAQYAVDKYSDEEVGEQIKLSYLEYKSESLHNGNVDYRNYMETSLGKVYGDENVEVSQMGRNLKIEINGCTKIYTIRYDGSVKEKEKVEPMTATSVYGKLDNGTLYLKATEDDNYILYTSSRVIQSDWKNVLKIKIEEPIAPTTCFEMFRGFENCTEIEGIEKLHTENSTSGNCMFCSCKSLTSIDVTRFETSKMNNISAMFYDCQGLLNIDISGFDTGKVTTFYETFTNCKSLKELDISNFNTSNSYNMMEMFMSCSSLENIDVSGFDTSNVYTFGYMFKGCSSLKNLNVKNFNTEKASNMDSMFYGCSSLTSLDVSRFNTNSVTNMGSMFSNLQNLESLNLSNFNTGNVTNMQWMFCDCKKLKKLDISNFTINHNKCEYIVDKVPSDIKIKATQDTANKIIANSNLTSSNFE